MYLDILVKAMFICDDEYLSYRSEMKRNGSGFRSIYDIRFTVCILQMRTIAPKRIDRKFTEYLTWHCIELGDKLVSDKRLQNCGHRGVADPRRPW